MDHGETQYNYVNWKEMWAFCDNVCGISWQMLNYKLFQEESRTQQVPSPGAKSYDIQCRAP
jgi:hypothetical protein